MHPGSIMEQEDILKQGSYKSDYISDPRRFLQESLPIPPEHEYDKYRKYLWRQDNDREEFFPKTENHFQQDSTRIPSVLDHNLVRNYALKQDSAKHEFIPQTENNFQNSIENSSSILNQEKIINFSVKQDSENNEFASKDVRALTDVPLSLDQPYGLKQDIDTNKNENKSENSAIMNQESIKKEAEISESKDAFIQDGSKSEVRVDKVNNSGLNKTQNIVEIGKPFKCDICGKCFTQKSARNRHKKLHTGEKPYKCDHCGKAFPQKTQLVLHERSHTGEKPFVCILCDKAFAAKSNLTSHEMSVHNQESIAMEFFNLEMHINDDDIEIKQEPLDESEVMSLNAEGKPQVPKNQWDKAQKYEAMLKKHMQKKKRGAPIVKMDFKCGYCGKIFNDRNTYNIHLRYHTGEKPYKCEFCGKSFVQSSQLSTHIRTHTGEKPHKCDQCEKAFCQKGELVLHIRTHTGEKPYKCDQCCKAFKQSVALTKHLRIHTGVKPYKCGTCDNSYADNQGLKKHLMKTMHVRGESLTRQNKLRRVKPEEIIETEIQHDEPTEFQDMFPALTENLKNFADLSKLKRDDYDFSSDIVEKDSKPTDYTDEAVKDKASGIKLEMPTHEDDFDEDWFDPSLDLKELSGFDEKVESEEKPNRAAKLNLDPSAYLESKLEMPIPDLKDEDLEEIKDLPSGKKEYERKHKCEYCGKGLISKTDLVRHIRTHTGEKPYKCDQCDKAFAVSAHLKNHIMTHTGATSHTCDQCGKSFVQRSHLTRHKKLHLREKQHKCDDCGETFYHKYELTSHLKSHFNGVKFPCKECDKTFVLEHHLKSHIQKIHSKEEIEKPEVVTCDYCGQHFRSTHLLKVHVRCHTGEKPYKCEYCGKSFTQNSHLNTHIRIHTGEKPYSCDQCDKAFPQKGELVLHIRTHTGEKPYTCDLCGKSFAQRIRLIRHSRTHTGVKPYNCATCGNSYADNSTLKKHLLKTGHLKGKTIKLRVSKLVEFKSDQSEA